ncbi:MAG: hypothetical protein Q9201_002406 [Fulgogasparrea decipioides]
MQQQYSMMKKSAAPVSISGIVELIVFRADIAQRKSTKGSSRRRNATINASSSAVNAFDGASEDKPDPTAGLADDDSDEAGSHDEENSPTRAQSNPEDSDQSDKPRKGRSVQKSRSSKRLTRLAQIQAEDEAEEPVSTRPKRARASGINYNLLLQNSDYDENAERPTNTDLPKPERKSKIIALRTGTPKHLIPEVPSPRTRKTRKTASINNDHETEVRQVPQQDGTPRRMSTRGMEAVNGTNTPDEALVDRLQKLTPRKRRGRIPSRLHVQDVDQQPVSATKPNNKISRKRKHSDVEASESNPATATTVDPTQEHDEEEGERIVKRRQARPKAHLGFLPNGQPRKRRKRRTREQMLLDEAKTTTDGLVPRRRSKYQFPFLDGYIGPPPPDEATIIARQEEQERQNPTRASTSDPETSSSLESLDGEDDGPLETPTQKPNISSTVAGAKTSPHPNTDAQLAAILTENRNTITAAAQSAFDSAFNSLQIPEIIFFPQDLAKGRENAVKLRTSLEEEKRSHQTSNTTNEALVAQLSASLAKELQVTTKLKAELNSIGADRSNLEKELQDTREDRENLQKEHDRLKVEKSNLEERLHSAETDLDATKADHDSLVADRDKYMRERNKHRQDLDVMKRRNDLELNKLSAMTTQMNLDEVHQATNESSLAQIQRLTAELETLKASKAKDHTFTDNKVNKNTMTDGPSPSAIAPPTAPKNSGSIKPRLSTLRNAHIRLAGHLRTTTEAHNSLKASIDKFNTSFEDDEMQMTMRGVRNVAKDLVQGSSKVDGCLKGARDASEGMKGEVMGLWDRPEG